MNVKSSQSELSNRQLSQRPETGRSRLPFWFAIVLAAVTFPLIWVGGLVTTHDAGMAVPDWPATYGYNLFLYPVSEWWNGPWDLFIEHGHRLLGSLAGLVTIGLVVVTWRVDERRWVLAMTIVALILVIAQGMLGGVRVLAADREIAKIHGCVGPAFFALAIAIAVVTSRAWQLGKSTSIRTVDWVWTLVFVGLAYTQLVLGANLRHIAVEADPVVHRSITLLHVIGALLTLVHVLSLAVMAWRGRLGSLKGWTLAALFAVLVQIGLGVGTWVVKFGFPEPFASWRWFSEWVIVAKGEGQANTITAHVALGSAILGLSVILMLRAARATKFAAGPSTLARRGVVDSATQGSVGQGSGMQGSGMQGLGTRGSVADLGGSKGVTV